MTVKAHVKLKGGVSASVLVDNEVQWQFSELRQKMVVKIYMYGLTGSVNSAVIWLHEID